MNDSPPSVSVVIPAFRAGAIVGKAIESIRSQDYPAIVDVIVAAGDEESASAARSEGAVVVENPSTRTPDALNLGLDRARGDVVVRCDAQSILPPGYVKRAVETLQRTGATNVGGMQIPVGETFWEKAIAAAMASPLGAGDARYRTGGEEGPVETVYLGVFDRKRIQELGGFDTTFSRNQDYELNHRIIESGGVVWFDPELKVTYRPRGSLKALWRQYYQYGQAKKTFSRLHPGSLRWRQMAPPSLIVALLASGIGLFYSAWALTLPFLYAATLITGSVLIKGANAGTVPALLTMHLAWGLGFMGGGLDTSKTKVG